MTVAQQEIVNTKLAPIVEENGVIKVSILGRNSIVVGYNLTEYIINELVSVSKASKVVLVTDKNLEKHHLEKFVATWNKLSEGSSKSLYPYVIPAGEGSKSRKCKAEIEDYMLSLGCTRDTLLIGMGGGVIGDLVGYVASTFMRGVHVVHLPTSLLAMVDSSIGGKTAIDVPAGKNLIGAFWQPLRVYVDLNYLSTLPVREFCNGMAEVIKTAAIADAQEFERIEAESHLILNSVIPIPNADATVVEKAKLALEKVVLSSIRFKAYVATEDEKEMGLRGLLNFGHSIGHAIEAILSPKLLHGECVAIGMVQEAEVARSLGAIGQVTLARLSRVLKLYKLPTSLHDPVLKSHLKRGQDKELPVSKLMDIIKLDKKNLAGKKRIVILSGIGSTRALEPEFVEDAELERAMAPSVRIDSHHPLAKDQHAQVAVPGSKSISNRALLLAALGSGQCKLRGLLHSDDTQVMLEALRLMAGVKYQWEDGGETLVIQGCGGVESFKVPNQEIYLGNAGTASRFLTSICALVTDKNQGTVVLTGNDRMKQRPIGPLVDALRSNGCNVDYLGSQGCLPLKFQCAETVNLKGGVIELSADVSSQYVSSILMAAPYTTTGVTLKLVGGKVISQPYIDMTLAMMQQFGVTVTRIEENQYLIPPHGYVNPDNYQVEGDASSATYPLSVAAITGTQCTVTNLGSHSLQGDARFAKDVLEPMGCTVTQTAMTTTVQGPPVGTLRCLPQIDMEPMTDAFLTASVLAAIATSHPTDSNSTPVTSISGIANQRVKECDRIGAMVQELGKLGVEAWELPDGLSIKGRSYTELKPTEDGVECFDDHRVAMSFSVLGTVVPDLLIREKRCVEKTVPNWWDILRHKLNVNLKGIDLPPHPEHSSGANKINPDSSVVIVGMRGAGKTTLGIALSKQLHLQFIDLDDQFLVEFNTTVREVVEKDGWDQFRRLEQQLLAKVLTNHSTNTVISCGGGIVEHENNRDLLKGFVQQGGVVVHLQRDIDAIVQYLNQDTSRPAYSNQESIQDVWQRRRPLYDQVSNFEFVSYVPQGEESNLTSATTNLTGLVQLARSNKSVLPKLTGLPTFFLCLTEPDLNKVSTKLETIVAGSDAVELRVDLLKAASTPEDLVFDDASFNDFLNYVKNQIALLRYNLPNLPIIYTLRTQSEGGKLPDTTPTNYLLALYNLAIRFGLEYLDLQLSFDDQLVDQIVQSKGSSLVISSYHDLKGDLDWTPSTVQPLLEHPNNIGEIVKWISVATNPTHNLNLEAYLHQHYQKPNPKPLIAINMGQLGQRSRITNKFFTPVTHPALQAKAAPGQLSVTEIHHALHLMGTIPSQQFYIFGSPIAKSPSPHLHTAIFQQLGLPYTLSAFDNPDASLLPNLMADPSFQGACVTIPHKVDIIPHLDTVDPVAQTIGAVNTVHVVVSNGKRSLVGYNTDWLGIYHTVQNRFTTHNLPVDSNTNDVLVLGAGGTSRAAIYALIQLGYKRIHVYNRSQERATQLQSQFQGLVQLDLILSMERLNLFVQRTQSLDVLIDTLPNHTLKLDKNLTDKAQVFVRLAYGTEGSDEGAKVQVSGLDILKEQARYQQLIWINRLPSAQFVSKVTDEFVAQQ